MSGARVALVAATAWLVATKANAANVLGEGRPDDRLEIAVVASPPLRTLVREAVDPLLPALDRIVWINRGAAAIMPDGDAVQPRRPRIQIDVPDAGEAHVTIYRPGEPPVVRALDGTQPPQVTIESVALIVHATARELLASAAETEASRAIERTAPPAAVLPAPVAFVVGQSGAVDMEDPRVRSDPPSPSLSIGLAYVQRSIMGSGALGDASVPWENGLSGSASVSIPRGRHYLLASTAFDYTHAATDANPGLPAFFRLDRYQGAATLGLGVRPVARVLVAGAAGAGIERVTYTSSSNGPVTGWNPMLRAALTVSVAVPFLPWGAEVVGAATVDLRESQTFVEYLEGSGGGASYYYEVRTKRVQPGFMLGLAGRLGSRAR